MRAKRSTNPWITNLINNLVRVVFTTWILTVWVDFHKKLALIKKKFQVFEIHLLVKSRSKYFEWYFIYGPKTLDYWHYKIWTLLQIQVSCLIVQILILLVTKSNILQIRNLSISKDRFSFMGQRHWNIGTTILKIFR